MFGLGKRRSRFGKFIDQELGYGGQERVREVSKISRETIAKICNNADYIPSGKTMKLLMTAVKKLTGKNVRTDDFWM
ncbi:hypothetical protein J31TS4_40520 [Paenibacillus sp. J31TS4]|uniref:transcriptional regulator n=1 Tax=Paenibacillus sp. J31TS4 TaxID=2807195 RepID=UPI001B20F951|nr:transcriptional regulator [Paenibacillus sp. J31TS4]GIP40772.1 hypothetical protein J31TS4_40520 [Paenibacillus sp. J31TS4]